MVLMPLHSFTEVSSATRSAGMCVMVLPAQRPGFTSHFAERSQPVLRKVPAAVATS
jgi:hypothetical protein